MAFLRWLAFTALSAPGVAIAFLVFPHGGFAAEYQNAEKYCEQYCGLWTYYDKSEQSKKYLKIEKGKSGTFKLREGGNDSYEYKNKINWYGDNTVVRDLKGNELTGIYLKPSGRGLQGEFISPNFYATHSQEFKFKLTLELKPSNKMLYSIWSSIRGGETETFEATRVGATEATKGSAKSTGETDQPIRIGVVQNTSAVGGCGCYFSLASPGGKTGRDGYIFFADYAGNARMNINGQDVELREVGREQAKGELGRCSKKRCKYTASGINAAVEYRETKKCPPEPTECEVTGYDVTITVEKGGLRQKVTGKGECGC